MFAAGGMLIVKQSLVNITRQDPTIRVRVKFTSGRLVHTDKGIFHYGELEVPRQSQKESFVPKLPYQLGGEPGKRVRS